MRRLVKLSGLFIVQDAGTIMEQRKVSFVLKYWVDGTALYRRCLVSMASMASGGLWCKRVVGTRHLYMTGTCQLGTSMSGLDCRDQTARMNHLPELQASPPTLGHGSALSGQMVPSFACPSPPRIHRGRMSLGHGMPCWEWIGFRLIHVLHERKVGCG